jgi:hypothetical protein
LSSAARMHSLSALELNLIDFESFRGVGGDLFAREVIRCRGARFKNRFDAGSASNFGHAHRQIEKDFLGPSTDGCHAHLAVHAFNLGSGSAAHVGIAAENL